MSAHLNHALLGFGRSDDDLDAWVVEQAPWSSVNISHCMMWVCDICSLNMEPHPPILSEAFRGHQVLINHAKNKRKGNSFLSPSAKAARNAEKKTLSWYCLFTMVLCTPNQFQTWSDFTTFSSIHPHQQSCKTFHPKKEQLVFGDFSYHGSTESPIGHYQLYTGMISGRADLLMIWRHCPWTSMVCKCQILRWRLRFLAYGGCYGHFNSCIFFIFHPSVKKMIWV